MYANVFFFHNFFSVSATALIICELGSGFLDVVLGWVLKPWPKEMKIFQGKFAVHCKFKVPLCPCNVDACSCCLFHELTIYSLKVDH